jgi:hypothetical protein
MDDAWEMLERAGVPCGPPSPEKPDLTDLAAVARATREVLARRERLDERQRVSLLSWLRAWASSFPTSFREVFGDEGDGLLVRAADGVEDVGRYLKLRRIAREKLLRVL